MENKVAHCPKCQKPVLTEAQFSGPVKFFMRCPSCQERLQVKVMVKIIAELFSGDRTVKQTIVQPTKIFHARLPEEHISSQSQERI